MARRAHIVKPEKSLGAAGRLAAVCLAINLMIKYTLIVAVKSFFSNIDFAPHAEFTSVKKYE